MKHFRQHRGALADSLETTERCRSMSDLLVIANRLLNPYEIDVAMADLRINPYGGVDKRCGWDTYIVVVDGYGVLGMTDGPA